MTLIIDNYDSFTYNLYQQIAKLGQQVIIKKHDEVSIQQILNMEPSYIVISPGPKRPENSGISMKVIEEFYKKIPILGVCLGHQCIGQIFGSKIISAQTIMHGKIDNIYHDGNGLFNNLPNPFTAARYHSLVIDKIPDEFKLSAWSSDGSIMAIQHNSYELYGVQFHPESFMSTYGDLIIKNFLKC
jgi:anthranilate synthase/aminodeoxychorismate synthase-like glutamine amidotransferase